MIRLCALAFAVVTLAGCASSPKVTVEQRNDESLTCEEIREQLTELDRVDREIEKNIRPSGAKVAAAVIWLPGLAYTLSDAKKAQELSLQRRTRLNTMASQRGCA